MIFTTTRMGAKPAIVATLISALTLLCHATSSPPPTGDTELDETGKGGNVRDALKPQSAVAAGAAPTVNINNNNARAFRDSTKPTGPVVRPFFDDVSPRNVTAVVGQSTVLNCRVKHVGDRTVSWMRKRDLHILTSNIFTYTGDARFSVIHPDPGDDWNLKIDYVQKRDAGIYECQVNTEPKINMAIQLNVEETNPVQIGTTALTGPALKAAQASIWGPEDVYVKKGSTISLTCSVNVHSTPPGSVLWYQGTAVVDFDSPRGGISLETEKTGSGTTSKLLVTKASLSDSGNYTCVPSNANPASVYVHVLNAGEYPAAMQHGEHGSGTALSPCVLLFTALAVLSWR